MRHLPAAGPSIAGAAGAGAGAGAAAGAAAVLSLEGAAPSAAGLDSLQAARPSAAMAAAVTSILITSSVIQCDERSLARFAALARPQAVGVALKVKRCF